MKYLLLFIMVVLTQGCTSKKQNILETLKVGDCFMVLGSSGINKVTVVGEYSLLVYNNYSQDKNLFPKDEKDLEIKQVDCFDLFKDQK